MQHARGDRAHDHAGQHTTPMRTHDDQITLQLICHLADYLSRLANMDMRRMKAFGGIQPSLDRSQMRLAFFTVIVVQGVLADMRLHAANRDG